MPFDFPKTFYFADSHEYACLEDDLVRIGISAFAVDQLGDIVFVDLPEVGSSVLQGSSTINVTYMTFLKLGAT